MSSIFVSYRRKDSSDVTGRITDHLNARFGDAHVFKDVDSIPAGKDFRGSITESVANCDVLLAIIGDEWLTISDDSGNRRIDDPNDYVHIEVATALRRGIPVVPVLVENESMPSAEELPLPIRELAFRNAVQVRPDPDFQNDVDRLCGSLDEHFTADEPLEVTQSRTKLTSRVTAACVVTLIVALGIWGASHFFSQDPEEPFDLSAAIQSAAPDASVEIPPGTFDAALVINKALTLRGNSEGTTTFRCNESDPAIRVSSGDPITVVIENISIVGTDKRPPDVQFDDLTTFGISVSGKSNVKLKAIEVSGCARAGIHADGNAVITVESTRIWGCFDGVYAVGGAEVHVSNSEVFGNKDDGFETDGRVQLVIDSMTVVTGNEHSALETGGYGSPQTTISNCVLTKNGGTAVSMIGDPTVTIRDTEVTKNAGDGIWMQNTAQLLALGCNISENEGNGIAMSDSTQAEIRNNTFLGNKEFGIAYGDASRFPPGPFAGKITPSTEKLTEINVFENNVMGPINGELRGPVRE